MLNFYSIELLIMIFVMCEKMITVATPYCYGFY